MGAIDLDKFANWNRLMAEVASTVDPHLIPTRLIEALTALVDADQTGIIVFSENRKPEVLYDSEDEFSPQPDLAKYLAGAYLLDPYYRSGIEKIEPGLYRMEEIAPAEFTESQYYQIYYQSSPIEDEIGFILYLDDNAFANVAFSREKGSRRFSALDFETLKQAQPAVQTSLDNYWHRTSAGRNDAGSELFVQLEAALTVFATSVLTQREAEIMRFYLYGHDTRYIAAKLGISAHTVAVHRKNFYARLDINSQADLFSLFISSMYCFQGDISVDPLEMYLNTPV